MAWPSAILRMIERREPLSVRGGARRLGPTFSNRRDCRRFGCQETPWSWGSHWVIERARLTGRETVVDLGAGDNPILHPALRERAKLALLIDRQYLPASDPGPNVERVIADIGDLPIDDESVDVAISVSVLEHLPLDRRDAAMREISRILRPGGRAVLSIGVPLGAGSDSHRLLEEHPNLVARNCSIFMPVDLSRMLSAAPDLELADARGLDHCPGFAGYDESALLSDRGLVRDRWADFPEVAEAPALARISTCELGVVLLKPN
jgi:SAM-dependent methyltransferase